MYAAKYVLTAKGNDEKNLMTDKVCVPRQEGNNPPPPVPFGSEFVFSLFPFIFSNSLCDIFRFFCISAAHFLRARTKGKIITKLRGQARLEPRRQCAGALIAASKPSRALLMLQTY